MLCQAGANKDQAPVGATSVAGKTPLLIATEQGHDAVVKVICDAGAVSEFETNGLDDSHQVGEVGLVSGSHIAALETPTLADVKRIVEEVLSPYLVDGFCNGVLLGIRIWRGGDAVAREVGDIRVRDMPVSDLKDLVHRGLSAQFGECCKVASLHVSSYGIETDNAELLSEYGKTHIDLTLSWYGTLSASMHVLAESECGWSTHNVKMLVKSSMSWNQFVGARREALWTLLFVRTDAVITALETKLGTLPAGAFLHCYDDDTMQWQYGETAGSHCFPSVQQLRLFGGQFPVTMSFVEPSHRSSAAWRVPHFSQVVNRQEYQLEQPF